ncbi:hypothetical protein F5146DRAFT_312524 [Armillaria mellea]|nr:hypothetical protein F5146DRAFT_312524 [Armillaria mellea]
MIRGIQCFYHRSVVHSSILVLVVQFSLSAVDGGVIFVPRASNDCDASRRYGVIIQKLPGLPFLGDYRITHAYLFLPVPACRRIQILAPLADRGNAMGRYGKPNYGNEKNYICLFTLSVRPELKMLVHVI